MRTRRAYLLALVALSAIASSIGPAFSQIKWPLRPLDQAHELNKTYGDWNGFAVLPNALGYHSAVDIPADLGDSVFAVEDGVVRWRQDDPGYQGFINVSRTTSDLTAWHWGHIHPDTDLEKGDSVTEGQFVGLIADFPEPFHDHLHFMRSDSLHSTVNAYCNPLAYLTPAPYQRPEIPNLCKIYYVQDTQKDTTPNLNSMGFIQGDVDIIVRAWTYVKDSINCLSGVYSIGYGVGPVQGGGNIPFRTMFEMRDTIKVADSTKYYLTYAGTVAEHVSYHHRNWYIVTNCGTSDPAPGYGLSNIEENCWPTKIDTSGTDTAHTKDEAKFPDGKYIVTLKAWAHSADSAVRVDTVKVDNFPPRLNSVFPPDEAKGVPIGTKVEATFDEPMDQSVTLKSVITFSPGASVSWQWVDSTKIRGTPNPSLEPGTNYTVTIHASVGSDSLTDIVGHLFDGDRNGVPGGDFQWNFETGDSDTTLGWPVPYQWDGATEWPYEHANLKLVDELYWADPAICFPFCGLDRGILIASESGSIWFDYADNTHHFHLPKPAWHDGGVLAIHNDCIHMIPDMFGDIWAKIKDNPTRHVIEWKFRIYGDTTNFEAVLFRNGWIRYDYNVQDIDTFHNDGGSGISCGDSVHYIDISPIYDVAPASYMFGPNVPPGSPANMEEIYASVGVRWEQNPESDLKGYYVYRASGADTTDTASLSRLCDTLITNTTYVDESALPCSTYWYAVSAVDTHWFEGALSNKVVGTVPPIPGAGPSATAYNTGRKVVKDRDQLRFYVTYASMDSIWVTFTDCEGCLWDIPYGIGEGKLPAIAVDDSNHAWIVWIGGSNGEIVYYSTLEEGSWTSPETLFDFELIRGFGSLSIAMDGSGYGNFLIDQVYSGIDFGPPTSFSTFLIRFYLHEDVQPWVTTIRSSSWLDAHSSIDCDDDGNLHVAWDEGDRISYRKGVSSGDTVIWEDPQVISAPAVPSKFPCIEYDRDSVSVVWQAQVGFYYQISHRRKTLLDTLWLSIERVDSSLTENTNHPVITGGSHAVWAQESEPVTVWYARREDTSWTDRQKVESTPYDSRFAHAISYDRDTQRYLLVCWTEDIEGPGYGVDNMRLQTSSLSPTPGTAAQLARAGSRPRTFGLSQNAPNPFARKTHMVFTLPKTENVVLDIYNVAGQRVRRLVNGRMKAGRYEMAWDGTDERMRKVGSGTYFAKLVAGSFRKTRKMVLVR